jgi:peroxiredoxin-like protein
METVHSYRVSASSTITRSGVAEVNGVEPSISFSAPPDFGGVAGHWTPEHLFVIAVASCYVSTFSGIADISHFEFVSLSLKAEGILQKKEGILQFSRIILRPVLKIAREEGRERALRLLEKADKSCLVARSIKCSLDLKPEIKIEEELSTIEKAGLSRARVM